ncbi:MAG TPA: hypothetical protein VGJ13_06715 [Pseudonocardiaceae bacterium]|jgi:hypothetical protein
MVIARVVAAAGLACDASVHVDLAAGFDGNTAVTSQGALFRVEAVVAVLAALLVLFIRWRAAAIVALLVAGSALGAVLLYGYVDIGALGPLPDMYEPTWYPEKILSAVAEGVATLAACVLLLRPARARDRTESASTAGG